MKAKRRAVYDGSPRANVKRGNTVLINNKRNGTFRGEGPGESQKSGGSNKKPRRGLGHEATRQRRKKEVTYKGVGKN